MKLFSKHILAALSICVILFVNIPANATTLAEIRYDVREALFETDEVNTIYTNKQINRAVRVAEGLMLDMLTPSVNYNLLTTAEIAVSTTEAYYTLPTNFYKLVACKYAGKPAIQVRPTEYYARTLQATLRDPMFCIMGDKIQVFPMPTSDTQDVYLHYLRKPDSLDTDGAILSTATAHDDFVIWATCYTVLQQDGQTDRAAGFKALMMDHITTKNMFMDGSNVITPPMIQTPPAVK